MEKVKQLYIDLMDESFKVSCTDADTLKLAAKSYEMGLAFIESLAKMEEDLASIKEELEFTKMSLRSIEKTIDK